MKSLLVNLQATPKREAQMRRSILVITDQTKNIGDHLLRLQVLHFLRTRLDQPTLRSCEWEAVDTGNNASDLATEFPTLSMKRQPLRVGVSAFGADLVIGPGQMIRDNMGVWFLIALALLVLISRCTGRQSYIVAVSVGRMFSRIHNLLWMIIIAFSSRVSFRDSASLKRAEEIFGPNKKFSKTSDLAFLASPYLDPLFERSGSKATPPPFVIIAPCNDPGEGRFLTMNRAVAIAMAAASAAGCNRVLFVAHDVREDADKKLATDCCTYFREQHSSGAMTASCLAPRSIGAVIEAYAEAGLSSRTGYMQRCSEFLQASWSFPLKMAPENCESFRTSSRLERSMTRICNKWKSKFVMPSTRLIPTPMFRPLIATGKKCMPL